MLRSHFGLESRRALHIIGVLSESVLRLDVGVVCVFRPSDPLDLLDCKIGVADEFFTEVASTGETGSPLDDGSPDEDVADIMRFWEEALDGSRTAL